MKAIVQVEFRQSTLELREDILRDLGYPITSVLGDKRARSLHLSGDDVAVIVIGHGAPWEQRRALVQFFRHAASAIPIVTLLRRSDPPIEESTFNCPADNPVEWVRTVVNAIMPVQ